MKASELVEKLSTLISSHGDLDVFVAGEMGWDEVDQAEIEIAAIDPVIASLNPVPWNAGESYSNDPAQNPRKEPLPLGAKFIGIV